MNIGFALAVGAAIAGALADRMITGNEVVGIINTVLAGLGDKQPLGKGAIRLKNTPAGGATIGLSPEVVKRLRIKI